VRWLQQAVGEQVFSNVSLRVRSGNDDTPVLYRREGKGAFGDPFIIEVTGEKYHQLERFEQAPLIDDEENWSQWKSVENDALVTAPGPRRYVQFRLDFSGRIFDAREVARLQFDYLQPPIADTLRAEVFPRLAEAEKPATFRYAVRLKSTGPVRGYDRLEIDTNIRVSNIRGLRVNGQSVDFTVVENEPEYFIVDFPLSMGMTICSSLLSTCLFFDLARRFRGGHLIAFGRKFRRFSNLVMRCLLVLKILWSYRGCRWRSPVRKWEHS
jgi:hypothetical protein